MAKRLTIQELADNLYDDPELAAAVVQDATEKGTVEAIERGERTMPHPQDARRWLDDKRRRDAEARK